MAITQPLSPTSIPPIRRHTLNPKQLHILYLLYKFRFGTTELLALCQATTSRRYTNTRLKILCEQGYIGRNYDSGYRLRGQYASYYLLPRGIKVLRSRPDFNPRVLRAIAKDRNASERFVAHSIAVFGVYCQLKQLCGDGFRFFTRSYLRLDIFDYFPDPLPDAYVSFEKTGEANRLKHFLLECFDGTAPEFVMRQRIEQLVSHADSGEWPPKVPYPEVLLVCKDEALQQKVSRWAAKALDEGWTNDVVMTAVTKEKLGELASWTSFRITA